MRNKKKTSTRRNRNAQKTSSYVTLTKRAHKIEQTDVSNPGPSAKEPRTHLPVTQPKAVARGGVVGPDEPMV